MPTSLIGMLEARDFGKVIIRLRDVPQGETDRHMTLFQESAT